MVIQNIISLINYYFRGTVPFLIFLNFLLLVVIVYFNRKELLGFFKKIKSRTWLILILIILLASFLRIFVAPHQTIMFGDEGWYMETAKNILEGNYGYFVRSIYKSIGWPFIIAVSFFFFGTDNLVAHYASSILGILTVFNIFCLALVFFKKENIALWSAFLFSLIPVHIVWSGSAETNVASVFFITLAIFFSALYFKQKNNGLFWLSLIAIAFACQMRIENYFLIPFFLLGLLIFRIKVFEGVGLKTVLRNLLFVGLAIMIVIPNLTNALSHHLSTNWGELVIEDQRYVPNFSLSNLAYNLTHQASHFLDTRYHPLIFSIFLIIGLIYALIKTRKSWIFLCIWFLLLFFIYFSCWSNLGPKSRFFMGFYPITTLFAGCGLYYFVNCFRTEKFKFFLTLILVLIIILSFFPHIKAEIENIIFSPYGKMQTGITHLAFKGIGKNCIVVANEPEMLTGIIDSEIIDLKSFLDIKDDSQIEAIFQKTNCVLFFRDYTCEPDMQFISGWRDRCQEMKKRYKLIPYLIYPEEETFQSEQITRKKSFLTNFLISTIETSKIEKFGFYKIFLK